MSTKTASRLDAYRERRNDYFAADAASPLAAEQREQFTGLRYFPELAELAFEVPLDESGPDVGAQTDLQTVDGQAKPFIRVGRIHFSVGDEPVTLSIFKDVSRGRYFLPFRDGTAGTETYTGGRYLDPRARPDGTLVVDFNYAYNPYCAYGEGWSCPIPAAENVTPVRIEAGEKAFAKE